MVRQLLRSCNPEEVRVELFERILGWAGLKENFSLNRKIYDTRSLLASSSRISVPFIHV